MKYSQKTVNAAQAVLRSRREAALSEADKKRAEFLKEHPELEEIEAAMSQIALNSIKAIDGCDDPKKYIDSLKQKSLSYRKAREDLFKSCGLEPDWLDVHYHCPKCQDTGYAGGVVCDCYTALLNKLSYEELAKKSSLKISSFDDFDASVYSDPEACEQMKDILLFCKKYAEKFSLSSKSLYMYGETGLGKTHLSLAIAGEVIKKGFNVVYGSAHNFFNALEREHFGRSDEPDGTTESRLLGCDLLIIDDLGAEFITSFSIAQLYNIIDSRLAEGLPTIINSNLSLDELDTKYNNRITSRLMCSYFQLPCIGNDVRQIKAQY